MAKLQDPADKTAGRQFSGITEIAVRRISPGFPIRVSALFPVPAYLAGIVPGLPIKTRWSVVWLIEKKLTPLGKAFIQYLEQEKEQIRTMRFYWMEFTVPEGRLM